MKINELRGKTEDELKSLLTDMKKEAFNLRFQKQSGELENTSRINEVRKTVAKIKTLQKEGVGKTKTTEEKGSAKKKPAKKEKSKKKAA